jgi:hypothetical protein
VQAFQQSNAGIILCITWVDSRYLQLHPRPVAHLRLLFAIPTATLKIYLRSSHCSALYDLVQVKFAGTAGLSIDKIGPQIAVVSLKNKRHVSPTLCADCSNFYTDLLYSVRAH